MAKALYRKYRPCKLSDVVGQEQVTDVLSRSLEQGKVSHAYLFIGPRGTGKTSVARIFAHEINKFAYELEDDYIDIIEIDGASNNGVDDVRELREKAAIAPTEGKYKIYIIDEVHMLTTPAFNALLKTLEEPPEHVIFIMATTDAHKVPVTITSRTQTYSFKLADAEVMARFLRKVADSEGIKIEDEAISAIAKRGGGSFRDSLSLLDQISTLSTDLITVKMVEEAMGLPEDRKIKTLLSECLGGDLAKITAAMRELLAAGVGPKIIAEEMVLAILADPQPESLGLLEGLAEVKAPFEEAKLLVALSKGVKAPVVKKVVEATCTQNVEVRSGDFNFAEFCEKVKTLNDAVATQVKKCLHQVAGDELLLFPDKKITRSILARDNNKKILIDAAGGLKVVLKEVGEMPAGAKKDELLAKISDIMGGKVQNDGGENPF
ncbi:MAG: DNA polymerase III subunit gamma/tau [Candidatus Saccharibacteria bacterium]|nr:DNA polymerase III subunit gamma/tau [Candidatus Saccharibacteria bacterium]